MTDKDNSVGYKRPPRHTRFKKGKSGNPRGRPGGSLNLGFKLEKVAPALVTVTESGKRKTLSKVDVALRRLVNNAAEGDRTPLSYSSNYSKRRATKVKQKPHRSSLLPKRTLGCDEKKKLT